MKTLTKAIAIASLVSASALTAQVANAEMSYSAGIATGYLWRGTELGSGVPAFSASADYSHASGAYAGIWASSGDTSLGNEYDLYVGYGTSFGDFSVDVQAVTYVYSSGTDSDTGADTYGSAGEMSDAIISLGFMDASFSYYQSLQSDDATYMTLGYSVAGVDLTVGINDDGAGAEYTHLDVSYGLTDELAITVSKVVDTGDDAAALSDWGVDAGEDAIVTMSYTLPIE
ncbi:histidine kinase [Bermanella marisrubri]|uniref:Histidine kinase n=1 Tax=Bermanella marisrubri TaxID=207949 RepID=Q1MZ24_9GAMM|nr:TorF family putative porin [Bermanella marisrubri]EAT11204.1 hypothetical protein RED65_07244 [Oceanobacter sp. RED65] [Bermanella marisrubri]QIZ85660.1 histidine kinase [Bermanella marisrubri]